MDAKELIINQLKREIEDLKRQYRDNADYVSKINNLEHMNDLLSQEKRRLEDDGENRNDRNIREIANLRSELESYSIKFAEKEIDFENLQNRNIWLEENYEQKHAHLLELEAKLNEQVEEKILLESDVRKVGHLNDELEKEKSELIKQVDRHNMYIDELTDIIKDREKNLNETVKLRNKLESELDQTNVNLSSFKKERDSLQYSLENQKSKYEKEVQNCEGQDFELQKKHKQIINFEEDTRILKKTIESEQRDRDMIMTENLSLKKHIVDYEHENEMLKDKLESSNNDYKQLTSKLTQARHDHDILKHKFEKGTITYQEIQEELRRFSNQITSVKEESLRKDKMREHKYDVEKDFKKALDSLHDAIFLPDYNAKPYSGSWSKKNLLKSYTSSKGRPQSNINSASKRTYYNESVIVNHNLN